MPAVTRPHSTLVAPPEGRASPIEAESAVQELRIAKARPSMDKGEKFLLSSCFLPKAASCWSSAVLSRRVGAMFSAVLSVVCRDSCQSLINGSGWQAIDARESWPRGILQVRHDRPLVLLRSSSPSSKPWVAPCARTEPPVRAGDNQQALVSVAMS